MDVLTTVYVEAGIGSLKARTAAHAARHGRLGYWTWDDVAAARLEANATARPLGLNGPTPDKAWAARTSIPPNDRVSFGELVEDHRWTARRELVLPPTGPLPVPTERTVDRIAIRRALVDRGVLLFSRRSIPHEFPGKKRKLFHQGAQATRTVEKKGLAYTEASIKAGQVSKVIQSSNNWELQLSQYGRDGAHQSVSRAGNELGGEAGLHQYMA